MDFLQVVRATVTEVFQVIESRRSSSARNLDRGNSRRHANLQRFYAGTRLELGRSMGFGSPFPSSAIYKGDDHCFTDRPEHGCIVPLSSGG